MRQSRAYYRQNPHVKPRWSKKEERSQQKIRILATRGKHSTQKGAYKHGLWFSVHFAECKCYLLIVTDCFHISDRITRLACYGYMNSISTYQAYLSTNQLRDYSDSSTGWIFSIYIALTFLCGIFVGPIFDAKGSRVLVLVGSILMMLSIMLMGVCTGNEPQF